MAEKTELEKWKDPVSFVERMAGRKLYDYEREVIRQSMEVYKQGKHLFIRRGRI